jgi:hypothetical protein
MRVIAPRELGKSIEFEHAPLKTGGHRERTFTILLNQGWNGLKGHLVSDLSTPSLVRLVGDNCILVREKKDRWQWILDRHGEWSLGTGYPGNSLLEGTRLIMESFPSYHLARTGIVRMHCATVTRGDAGVVLIAPSVGGKTTLSLALCFLDDFSLVCDETGFYDAHNSIMSGYLPHFTVYPDSPLGSLLETQRCKEYSYSEGHLRRIFPLEGNDSVSTAPQCRPTSLARIRIHNSGTTTIKRIRSPAKEICSELLQSAMDTNKRVFRPQMSEEEKLIRFKTAFGLLRSVEEVYDIRIGHDLPRAVDAISRRLA